MHKLFKLPALMILAAFVLASCKKEGEQFNVKKGEFPGSALTTLQTAVVLTEAKDSTVVLTINCQKADYGQQPAIIYTLQMDLPTDTGAGKWNKAINYSLNPATRQFDIIGKNLNTALKTLGATSGTPRKIVFRVKAEVRTNKDEPTPLGIAYSNTIEVTITPYVSVNNDKLYVPGGYQGWNPATAPVIAGISDAPGKFEGYVNITGADLYFKYTSDPDWNHINYGAGPGNTFNTDGLAAGLSVPEPGYYELTADLNANTWTATKTIWSIIGDASPGGWDTDTDMDFDPVTQVWTKTLDMKKEGSFKFRANHAWSIDFGVDDTGKMVYVDNPFLPYNPQNNMTVPEDGNYTITLDLHISQNYTYTLKKN